MNIFSRLDSTAGKFARKVATCLVAAAMAACVAPALAFADDASGADGTASRHAWDANSWRYVDGVPTDEAYQALNATECYGMLALNSSGAWSLTPSGYVNDEGDVIDGAFLRGVDVSEWQYSIDWAAAKADDTGFAIIRCGWGSNYSDQDDAYWEQNVAACEAQGIPYGVYLYSYAESVEDAQSEAEHAIRLLQGHNPKYPVYLDLEESDMGDTDNRQLLADIATTFCSTVRAAGYDVGVYASLTWWTEYLTDSSFGNWDRWVAQWNSTCDYPKGAYSIWQCTSSAKVNGISGRVDLDFQLLGMGGLMRMYNPDNCEHLWTTDKNEVRYLSANTSWKYEGNAWATVDASNVAATPVWRLYNPDLNVHHYTSDANEVRVLVSEGEWQCDNDYNAMFYAYGYQVPGSSPVYRLYNDDIAQHLLTQDYNEVQVLTSQGDWEFEAVAFYA